MLLLPCAETQRPQSNYMVICKVLSQMLTGQVGKKTFRTTHVIFCYELYINIYNKAAQAYLQLRILSCLQDMIWYNPLVHIETHFSPRRSCACHHETCRGIPRFCQTCPPKYELPALARQEFRCCRLSRRLERNTLRQDHICEHHNLMYISLYARTLTRIAACSSPKIIT